MQEVQEQGGAQNQEDGVQTDEVTTKEDEVSQPESNQEMVTKEQLEHVLSDMHRFKKQAKEYESKYNELSQNASKKENEELKQKQRYKELAEKYEHQLKDIEESERKTKEAFLTNKKLDALRGEAMKQGIKKEALDDLDFLSLDDVQIEFTSTGRAIVSGADMVVNELKKTRSHWFETGETLNFNPGGATNKAKQVPDMEYSDIAKFKYKDPKKYAELKTQWLNKKLNKGA